MASTLLVIVTVLLFILFILPILVAVGMWWSEKVIKMLKLD